MLRVAPLFIALCVLHPSPAAAADPPSITYRDDRLTVHATDVPVSEVLDQVKRQSGATVRGAVPADKVSATFDALPLREGLARILGDRSFTLIYADTGRLKAIELKGGAGTRKPAADVARSDKDGKKARWDTLEHVFDDKQPVPVDGKVAAASGKSEVSWPELLRTAVNDNNPVVRAEAFRAAVREVDRNPVMRDAVLKAVTPLSAEELAEFVRVKLGEQAIDNTVFALQNIQSPELRVRLRAALQVLRSGLPLHTAAGS
jgi:hypothetical protein